MRRSAGGTRQPSNNRIVRRMMNLPKIILERCSRIVDQGIGHLMEIVGRRNHNNSTTIAPLNHTPNVPQQNPINFPFHSSQEPHVIHEAWAFLENFEQHFGSVHPFFYACNFMEAMKIAQDDHKFLFVYLHSPDHPFTSSFCEGTLCSELAVQFLDANLISWGILANTGEGLRLASTVFSAQSFPFCAVVATASGDGSMVVLKQMECPVSPAELVEILQNTLEEQATAFGSTRFLDEENRRADRRLREEQDAAYVASLTRDQEMEKSNVPSTSNHEVLKHSSSHLKQHVQGKEDKTEANRKQKANAARSKNVPLTQILIRFPNGERKEHSFLSTDKVKEIYTYIGSLGLLGSAKYRLISNFPKKVYGVEEMRMSLKDAALHPKASLFIEFL